MWGQVALVEVWYRNTRIIPTRVGTRSVKSFKLPTFTDHPHACGDKQIYDKLTEMRARIIPTRVGTRQGKTSLILGFRDHPHACGDKTAVIA